MSSPIAFALLATLGAVEPDPLDWEALTTAPPHALCIGMIPPEQVRKPRRRHRLLPTVSVGLDHQPRTDVRAQSADEHRLADDVDIIPDDGRHQYDERSMTRWTLTLRWNSGSSSRAPAVNPPRRRHTKICRKLLDARAHRPADLSSAVDHWIELTRHRALLELQPLREVHHD